MLLIEIIVILLSSVLLNFRVIRLWLLFYFLLFFFFLLVLEFMLYAPLRVIGDNFYSLDVRLCYCKYNL